MRCSAEPSINHHDAPSKFAGKSRRLNYSKCTFCRGHKKAVSIIKPTKHPISNNSAKCSPADRICPGQKFHRYAEMGFDCSDSVTMKAGGEDRTARTKPQSSTKKTQNGPEREQRLYEWRHSNPPQRSCPCPLLRRQPPQTFLRFG